ncbi:hypothetical protein BDA99DRAFT_559870 [Phascolomyces articulosus]|uniref:F-box domain-containing protein n=1 Tax=Phascolomyces articulosus TaxID=60185 RepID=A0AAD5PEB0_9FUNG|nr:hypothetical protein BDA99DRAFT_559870 [Phascolomyces articulosus]
MASTPIDSISALPWRVTFRVLQCLSIRDLSELRLTSRHWRQCVIRYGSAWISVTITNRSAQLINMLPRIALFIEHLTLDTYSENIEEGVMVMMMNGEFKNLRSLEDGEYLLLGLERVENTLVKLIIQGERVPMIQDVLHRASKLTHLPYSSTFDNIGIIYPGILFDGELPDVLPLTHLQLKVPDYKDIEYPELELLLQHTPNLRYLKLSRIWGIQLVENLVSKYCPSIELFAVEPFEDPDLTGFDIWH